MGLLNVGVRSLLANQAALQTIGHNISNVNTAGYSRQGVLLETSGSQYTGGGYIGRGVTVANVLRSHSDFLTRQATLAASAAASDQARASRLTQLEDIFPGGASGLGAAVTDMLNAFTDVGTAPTDLTARAVVLTRAQEMSSRFNGAATRLNELQTGTRQQLEDAVTAANGLLQRIAKVNDQIALAAGQNQAPNDLLDQRETLIKDLNRYVQTTQVAADDGTTGVFIGSQPVVLGIATATLSLVRDPGGDPSRVNIAIGRAGAVTHMDENGLNGGEMAGLLKVHNGDIPEARNMLGRIALATTTSVNAQHAVGLNLDGTSGGNFFKPQTLADGYKAAANTGTATVQVAVADASLMAASDYQVRFTSGTAGEIVRLSDGKVTAMGSVPGATVVDGLTFTASAGANANDSFVVKPFALAATQIGTLLTSPRELAVGNPAVVSAAPDNQGTVGVSGFTVTPQFSGPAADVVITFDTPTSYTVTQPPAAPGASQPYTAGGTIALNGWQLTLKGTPKAGDLLVVQANDSSIATPTRAAAGWPTTPTATPVATIGGPIKTTAGNADALANLRDQTMFDGSPLSDGYAGLMSQIGVRVQSASYNAGVSQSILGSAQGDEAAVSGVNLDEEAAKLLQYQQAYQASAKMIQIAQGIFDSVIAAIAR
ncbi:flagellar hook-associated protein FlgK [uncultured Xylophilus sp.]|uniref:flagellar hook-associated protein FlgK n=1 Tax=uncultured Xylophilus sp. TaxID=296832 RepID=UPI0025F88A73|nr:flagellar hook-associated protein FlgK [uncultured Xylophilus sp.]